MPSSKIPRLEQSFLGEAVEDRKKLLSDRGSGRLARAFEEYLRMLAIRHIYCARIILRPTENTVGLESGNIVPGVFTPVTMLQ